MNEMKIWTGWTDYLATGEGRTIKAIVARAIDEVEFKKRVAESFGDYFAMGSQVGAGVVRNGVTELLWSPQLLDFIEANRDRGSLSIAASAHFNFA